MADQNLGSRRSDIYASPKKPRLGMWLLIAAAAVALVLFFVRRNDREMDSTRGAPSGMGRRAPDDRSVRPTERQDDLRAVPPTETPSEPAPEQREPTREAP